MRSISRRLCPRKIRNAAEKLLKLLWRTPDGEERKNAYGCRPEKRGSESCVSGILCISSAARSIVGPKEGEGPLGDFFDLISQDAGFGEKNWEKAESTLQKEALTVAAGKAKLSPWQIRYLFGGDLLAQLSATSFGAEESNLPFFGLYGACSTCGRVTDPGGYGCGRRLRGLCGGYYIQSFSGAQRRSSDFPWPMGISVPFQLPGRVTGSGAFILASQGGYVKITGVTPGKIVDMGVKDNMNMGACMAPAACDTIYQNLMDFNRQPEDYDRIITGDLGYVGQEILIQLLKEKGFDISSQHMDCGIEIYDRENQDTHAGGQRLRLFGGGAGGHDSSEAAQGGLEESFIRTYRRTSFKGKF